MSLIHSSAQISPDAQIADDVSIGPFTIIDGPAIIGAGCEIAPHVWIHGAVTIGVNNKVGYGAIIGGDPQDMRFDPATESGVIIGEGNVIREYVSMHRATVAGSNTVVGDGNFFMTGVHLAHDVTVRDKNILANNVLLGGFVEIGNSTLLSGGSAFHQFVRIGDFALVQGLTGCSKDVPPYCVLRSLNRLAGLNTIGMRRGGLKPDERKEIKSVYNVLFQRGLALDVALEELGTREWGPAAVVLVEAARNPGRQGIITREE